MKLKFLSVKMVLRNSFVLALLIAAKLLQAQTLVWSEEFGDSELDTDIWTYDFGTGSSEGISDWGNSELQYYTSRTDNVYLSGGNLYIEALEETFDTKSFTSGRINTEGRVHFQYGTLEARIKIPNLQDGLWPAFWLLGVTGGTWPANGEIDIAEWGSAAAIADGTVNKRVNGACHWEYDDGYAGYGTYTDHSSDLNDDYHVYKIVWSETMITCYLDDVEYYAIENSSDESLDMEEFHNYKYIILNLAVGGTYPDITSTSGITASLPAQMIVDYIRLYQDDTDGLWLGTEEAECGEYGVLTESSSMSDNLDYGSEANIYTWNGLTSGSTSAYEGSEVLSYTTTSGTWYGLGISIEGRKNMSKFYGGSLKFHLKTNSSDAVKVGVSTGHGESWIELDASHGYSNDNTWDEITLPFSEFYDLDLGSVKQMFMITGDVPTSSFNLDIDNIYYSGGEDCTDDIDDVSVTSVSLSPTSSTLSVSETVQLIATISPSAATTKTVSYSSSSSSVATVSSTGLVTAVSSGSATITVSTTDGGYTATSAITVSSTSTGSDTYFIEAEDYTSMSGVATEDEEDDFTGLDVGWIDAGDWMEYSITVETAGTYTSTYRVASQSLGGDFTVSSDGSTIDELSFDATGDWQEWTTVTSTVSLTAGTHTILITATSSGWNINWFQFELDDDDDPTTTSDCSVEGATGDYTAEVSDDYSNPTITFVPTDSDNGSTTCILYYGTTESGVFGGQSVTPNEAYQISASNGETIYFYYTYSLATGGENNTSGSRNNFTVGTCSSLKSASLTSAEELASATKVYPNPTSDLLNIEFDENKIDNVQIMDLTGKLIYTSSTSGSQKTINMVDYAPGIYMVVLSGTSTLETIRLIHE